MWYWYELFFIWIFTDLILDIFFKKQTEKIGLVVQEYVMKKLGFK